MILNKVGENPLYSRCFPAIFLARTFTKKNICPDQIIIKQQLLFFAAWLVQNAAPPKSLCLHNAFFMHTFLYS